MSLIKNAVDSLVLATEDYEWQEPRRILSCTRNLYAAMLLLFKEKLRRLSPPNSNEALIKSKIVPKVQPDGSIAWEGEGKTTVNVQEIKKHFKNLGINIDWGRIKKIQGYRNDIEHYYSSVNLNSAKTYINDCFVVIRDFVRKHLDEDPLVLFGEEPWNTFVKINEIYQKEKNECITRFQTIDWKNQLLNEVLGQFRCNKCGSDLMDVTEESVDRENSKFRCRACGVEWGFESMVVDAVADYWEFENYLSFTDGNDPGYIQCPECGSETYLVEENECLICSFSMIRECQRCGIDIPVGELDGSGFCGCCSYQLAKND